MVRRSTRSPKRKPWTPILATLLATFATMKYGPIAGSAVQAAFDTIIAAM